MTRSGDRVPRTLLAFAHRTASALAIGSLMTTSALAQSVDLSKWSPEYVKLDRRHRGRSTRQATAARSCRSTTRASVTFWYTGPFEADPQIAHDIDKEFWEAFKATYPNIQTDVQSITYNELLDKFRTALLGNAAPMVVRLQILGGVEFAAKGYLQALKPEDVGYTTADFWPGAMKSVTWEGKTYGIPTNNETMALIWNAEIFKRCRSRSGEAAGDLGRRRHLLQADPRQARHRRLRPGRQAERRQHAVPLHAAALGLRRRRARRSRRRTRPTSEVRLNSDGSQGARCRRPTTCMSATSRCRSRR